jgi:hypothetical protein
MGKQQAMPYTLAQAGKAIGKNKTTVLRAIKAGKLSAVRDEATGGWIIEPAELHRLYPAVADASVHPAANGEIAAIRNGHIAEEIAAASALRVQLEAAEVRIADRNAQIAGLVADKVELNRRLDRAEDDRRELLSALSAAQAQMKLLTDQRASSSPVRQSWWRRVFGR